MRVRVQCEPRTCLVIERQLLITSALDHARDPLAGALPILWSRDCVWTRDDPRDFIGAGNSFFSREPEILGVLLGLAQPFGLEGGHDAESSEPSAGVEPGHLADTGGVARLIDCWSDVSEMNK